MKKAVVTGATGGVGVNLINELIENGYEVSAVCRPASKRIVNIPKSSSVKIYECDASNYASLPALIGEEHDLFYHFAWEGTFGASRNDAALQERNVKYTIDAADAASKLGCKAFVGAGSQSEFGHVDGVLSPQLACFPDNGYGAAKLSAGVMSRVQCASLGIRHCWCRILSMYGPFDARHSMVMSMTEAFLSGKRPSCTKGDQIWDYIYAKDAARALRLVGETGKDGSVYCLGSGTARTLKEYILAIRDAAAPNAEVGFGEIAYYPHQVMRLQADITNLTSDTGFLPSYTFEEGIRETVQWVRENYK